MPVQDVQTGDASKSIAPKITKRWSNRLWHGLQTIILWYGVSASVLVALRATIGGSWTFVALFNNFIPWCAAVGIFWGIIALFSRRRWLLVSLQIPLIVLFVAVYGRYFQEREPINPPSDGLALRVSTYNVFSVSSDVERIIGVIRDMDADIVGLQELGVEHSERFENDLGNIYPYQALYPGEEDFGIGILSRYPLVESEVLVNYENFRGDVHTGLMRVVVDVDGVLITVYIAHPPVPSPFSFRDNVPRFYDDNLRDGQLNALRERVEDEVNPVLVLCDCNMTDQSEGYQALDRVLDDSFLEAGKGLGFTVAPQPMGIPSILPLIMRVDYVWLSEDFVAIEAFVGKDDGSSDHRPVIAELVLR